MANLQKIKTIAKEKGIKLGYLCQQVGITQQALARIMRENTATLDNIERIAAVLGVPVTTFFDEAPVSVSSVGDNNNVVGKGTISTAKDIGKALDILHEQLNRKDEQINGLIQALNR
jgi:transcriptional regulator with XRE-family HTH domain